MCYDNNARRPRTLSPRSTWPKISSRRLRCAPHIHIKSARPGVFGSLGRQGPWVNHSVGVAIARRTLEEATDYINTAPLCTTYRHYRYTHRYGRRREIRVKTGYILTEKTDFHNHPRPSAFYQLMRAIYLQIKRIKNMFPENQDDVNIASALR